MTLRRVSLERQAVVEPQEQLAIVVIDVVGRLDLLSEPIETVVRVRRHIGYIEVFSLHLGHGGTLYQYHKPLYYALRVADMEEIVIAIFKAGELAFDFAETVYEKFFSDETDDDQQNQSEIDEAQ